MNGSALSAIDALVSGQSGVAKSGIMKNEEPGGDVPRFDQIFRSLTVSLRGDETAVPAYGLKAGSPSGKRTAGSNGLLAERNGFEGARQSLARISKSDPDRDDVKRADDGPGPKAKLRKVLNGLSKTLKSVQKEITRGDAADGSKAETARDDKLLRKLESLIEDVDKAISDTEIVKREAGKSSEDSVLSSMIQVIAGQDMRAIEPGSAGPAQAGAAGGTEGVQPGEASRFAIMLDEARSFIEEMPGMSPDAKESLKEAFGEVFSKLEAVAEGLESVDPKLAEAVRSALSKVEGQTGEPAQPVGDGAEVRSIGMGSVKSSDAVQADESADGMSNADAHESRMIDGRNASDPNASRGNGEGRGRDGGSPANASLKSVEPVSSSDGGNGMATVDILKGENTLTKSGKAEIATFTQRLEKSVLGQIDHMMRSNVRIKRTGDSQVTMKLKPENLGSVSIKLTMDGGSLSAKVTVDSMMVKSILENNLSDLKATLAEKGYSVSGFDVGLSGGNGSNRDTGSGHSGGNRRSGQTGPEVAGTEEESLPERLGTNSSVIDSLV